jgi:hypothetical protein
MVCSLGVYNMGGVNEWADAALVKIFRVKVGRAHLIEHEGLIRHDYMGYACQGYRSCAEIRSLLSVRLSPMTNWVFGSWMLVQTLRETG